MDTLEAVIANEELSRRAPRARRGEGVGQAVASLSRELASSPRRVLQKLADATLDLCQADSAGVSLLESGGREQFFRWHAVAGKWGHLLWTTLPREFSPCGTVLDRKAAQLMVDPERHFTPLAQVPPKVHEALLVPFEVGGALVGTVWAVSQSPERRFDREDRQVLSQLAEFAAQAYQRLSSLSGDDVVQLARMSHDRPQKAAVRAQVQKRVLVVDDHRDSANSLAALLRALGHETFVAYDGRSALDALSVARPDVALIDIALPDMSGYDVARQVRGRLGPAVRIVALSGFGLAEDRERSMEAGFEQHMVKPADPVFLKSLLG